MFAALAEFLLITALLIDVLSIIGTLSIMFQGDIANLSVLKHSVISTVDNNVYDRFPEDNLELLECFDIIFNPRNDVRELGNHGIQQLNKLCHHFEAVLDSGRCKNQFLQFKHLVHSERAMNFEEFTSTLIQEYKHVHPDFVQLALISLVILISSAP